jgi:hypothetical protein
MEMRGDQAPRKTGGFRRDFERKDARGALNDSKARKFQPVAQVFGKRHVQEKVTFGQPFGSPCRSRLMAPGAGPCQAAGPATKKAFLPAQALM